MRLIPEDPGEQEPRDLRTEVPAELAVLVELDHLHRHAPTRLHDRTFELQTGSHRLASGAVNLRRGGCPLLGLDPQSDLRCDVGARKDPRGAVVEVTRADRHGDDQQERHGNQTRNPVAAPPAPARGRRLRLDVGRAGTVHRNQATGARSNPARGATSPRPARQDPSTFPMDPQPAR